MADPKNPLYRSRSQRMIAGICGGIAQWLGWDATLVRVLCVLVTIFSGGGPGLLAYLVLWAVMPEEPEEPAGDSSG
jgi:phage shock protein C